MRGTSGTPRTRNLLVYVMILPQTTDYFKSRVHKSGKFALFEGFSRMNRGFKRIFHARRSAEEKFGAGGESCDKGVPGKVGLIT